MEAREAAPGGRSIEDKPDTTFGTMNADVLENVSRYVRPNFCDFVRGSRFET
jgi:hypothetical protein